MRRKKKTNKQKEENKSFNTLWGDARFNLQPRKTFMIKTDQSCGKQVAPGGRNEPSMATASGKASVWARLSTHKLVCGGINVPLGLCFLWRDVTCDIIRAGSLQFILPICIPGASDKQRRKRVQDKKNKPNTHCDFYFSA